MATSHQQWDPAQYARDAGFVSELGAGVLELLAPRAGERILDLGCGDGVLAERMAALGCAVVAVDSSAEQIAAARARGLDARVEDGERLAYTAEFDAVFSNAALHWMPRADDVLAGVFRALRPGGRFVGEFGGFGNVEKIRRALGHALERRGLRAEDPWYFPTDREYAERLQHAGFSVRTIALFDRPTPLAAGIEAWLATFAGSQLAAIGGEAERRAILSEVRDSLAPELHGPAGWSADYVRLRFQADKPTSRQADKPRAIG